MTNAYVLMTAMPPTHGHLDLIRFASSLSLDRGGITHVIVCTQPGEPFVGERVSSLREATQGLQTVVIHHIHRTLPQEPEGHEGFWDMWTEFLEEFGHLPGDYIVASEAYGKTLAKHAGGVFMPYDMTRSIRYTKATRVREDPMVHFQEMIPEFRKYLVKTVTIFGAESVGKTTVARSLVKSLGAKGLPEWARPYLETMGTEITDEVMKRIMYGQAALQRSAKVEPSHPYIIQDTDLFSTLGYWEMWSPTTVTSRLSERAHELKSDLYVILSSDIPFEPDPLRYGGDKRESEDQYWIDLCEREGLPYVYIDATVGRSFEARRVIQAAFETEHPLSYQREGAEYEKRD